MILRTNHAEYPATATSPAVVHDDLMIIYTAGEGVHAHFYDTEGHLIHYTVTFPAPNQALFMGDITPGAPRFRLNYKLRADGVVEGEFGSAPPGQPEAFKPYLAWEMRKAGSAGR